jgi:hypothetical protein
MVIEEALDEAPQREAAAEDREAEARARPMRMLAQRVSLRQRLEVPRPVVTATEAVLPFPPPLNPHLRAAALSMRPLQGHII